MGFDAPIMYKGEGYTISQSQTDHQYPTKFKAIHQEPQNVTAKKNGSLPITKMCQIIWIYDIVVILC